MEFKEIKNPSVWERFISRNNPMSFFQSWKWGEVEKNSGTLLRLGFFEGKKMVGSAQVMVVQARRGIFLHVRHGPVFSVWKRKYLNYFVSVMKKIAAEERAVFVRISPLIDNSDRNSLLFTTLGFRDAPIHAMDGEYCWLLDISPGEEELMSQMRKTTRNLIRQAQKMGVLIQKSTNRSDLDTFLPLYDDTAKRHNFIKHKGIIEEFNELTKDNSILIFKGMHDGKILSMALIIFHNNQAIYHHSASIAQKVPVNYLLQWEAIREAKRRGMKYYNFWGIAPEGKSRHPWKGLTVFKKGFGGRAVEYIHAKDLPCSLKYCATYLVESLRKLRKGY